MKNQIEVNLSRDTIQELVSMLKNVVKPMLDAEQYYLNAPQLKFRDDEEKKFYLQQQEKRRERLANKSNLLSLFQDLLNSINE